MKRQRIYFHAFTIHRTIACVPTVNIYIYVLLVLYIYTFILLQIYKLSLYFEANMNAFACTHKHRMCIWLDNICLNSMKLCFGMTFPASTTCIHRSRKLRAIVQTAAYKQIHKHWGYMGFNLMLKMRTIFCRGGIPIGLATGCASMLYQLRIDFWILKSQMLNNWYQYAGFVCEIAITINIRAESREIWLLSSMNADTKKML